MNKSILLALLIFLPVLPARAELWALPAGDFTCSVTVSPSPLNKPSPSPKPRLTGIEVRRGGEVSLSVCQWSDGSRSELWSAEEKHVGVLASNRETKEVYLLTGDFLDVGLPRLIRFNKADYEWITEQARVAGGGGANEPIHYRAEVTRPFSGEPAPERLDYQAWIDPATLRPVRLDDGTYSYELRFTEGARLAPLAVPPEVRREFQRWVDYIVPKAHR